MREQDIYTINFSSMFMSGYSSVDKSYVNFDMEIPKETITDGRKIRGVWSTLITEGFKRSRDRLFDYVKYVQNNPDTSEEEDARELERLEDFIKNTADDTNVLKLRLSMQLSTYVRCSDENFVSANLDPGNFSYYDKSFYVYSRRDMDLVLPLFAFKSREIDSLVKETLSLLLEKNMAEFETLIPAKTEEHIKKLVEVYAQKMENVEE